MPTVIGTQVKTKKGIKIAVLATALLLLGALGVSLSYFKGTQGVRLASSLDCVEAVSDKQINTGRTADGEYTTGSSVFCSPDRFAISGGGACRQGTQEEGQPIPRVPQLSHSGWNSTEVKGEQVTGWSVNCVSPDLVEANSMAICCKPVSFDRIAVGSYGE